METSLAGGGQGLFELNVTEGSKYSEQFFKYCLRGTTLASLSDHQRSWCVFVNNSLLSVDHSPFRESDYLAEDGVTINKYPNFVWVVGWHKLFLTTFWEQSVFKLQQYGFTLSYGTPAATDKPQGGKPKAIAASTTSTSSAAATSVNALVPVPGSNPRTPAFKRCDGCGRNPSPTFEPGHATAACPFKLAKHPGANYHGPWDKSQSFKNLQLVPSRDGTGYRTLQYHRHAVQANGSWTLQHCDEGPDRPVFPKPTVSFPIAYNLTITDHYADLTSAFSLLNRNNSDLYGELLGQRISILIDTGATDYNYIARCLVHDFNLPIFKMSDPVRVRSVHGFSIVVDYAVVNVTLIYVLNTLSICIPCLVLDSSPRDVILGLPAITSYNLLNRFSDYFKALSSELAANQRLRFPGLSHRVSHTETLSLTDGSVGLERCTVISPIYPVLASIESYPYPRAPILDPAGFRTASTEAKATLHSI
jgi:hypothetical protein